MKTIEEIYAAINPLPAMLSARGKVRPEVTFHIEANARIRILITWCIGGKARDWERHYEHFTDNTADEVIAQALQFITDLPDAKTSRLHEFMGQLGKVIDSGRDLGVDVDFLNPLTETMKRLSENIITYQTSKPASSRRGGEGSQ